MPARGLLGLAVATVVLAAPTAPAALTFSDQSAVSGGPVDFGAPTSDVEKATAAWVDTDGDGFDDLVTLTGEGQAHGYFVNRSTENGRTLVPAPHGNGLDSGTPFRVDGACITAGDVDNDGDQDLFIGGGWNPSLDSGENALLVGVNGARFTDVTAAAGLLDGNNTTAACVLFDMDLDGDLDLLFANTDFPETSKHGDGVTHLMRNLHAETGRLEFVDETAARGIVEVGKAVWQATAYDYDRDGDQDLLITHDIEGLAQLFANDGTGFFEDVTAEVGAGAGDDATPSTFGDDSRNAMGVAVGDVDNDGRFDVYVSNIARNPLYLGGPGGTYREAADERGCSASTVAWGAVFADFDLDGFVDLHVAHGDVWNRDREFVRPTLFHNRGDGSFDEVFAASGMRYDPPLHREMGTAASDYDADGRVDVLVARAHRHEGASPYLYRNTTDVGDNRFVALSLRGDGRATNTSAIGATLRIRPRDAAGDPIDGLRQLRIVTASDSRGARSSLWQTVGVGAVAETVDVRVVWPRLGDLAARRETYRRIPVGARADRNAAVGLAARGKVSEPRPHHAHVDGLGNGADTDRLPQTRARPATVRSRHDA